MTTLKSGHFDCRAVCGDVAGAVGFEPTTYSFGGRVKLKRPSKLFPLLSRL